MAELTAARNNAFPFPIYGVPWVEVFPLFDASGGLVAGATGLDTEVSKNCDSFVDCTNEAVEIGNGFYYIILTMSEMTSDIVSVVIKNATAKALPMVFHPRKYYGGWGGTCASTGPTPYHINLATSSSPVDGVYAGCLIGIQVDGTWTFRMITSYVGATKQAGVSVPFPTYPDSDDNYEIYLVEGVQTAAANIIAADNVMGAGIELADAALKRDWEAVTGTVPNRSTLNALRFLRNKWYISGTTLHTTKEDDATDAWTGVITPAPGASPIAGMDPS